MSKFASIITAKREIESGPRSVEDDPQEPAPATTSAGQTKTPTKARARGSSGALSPTRVPEPSPSANVSEVVPTPAPARATQATASPSKKPGKRSDPEYAQVSAWIRKQTHHEVKLALLKEGKNREFSELVQELLSRWLKTNT